VAGGDTLTESVAPGGRVDVLVSTEGGSGRGRTFLALEDVEVLSLRAGGGESGSLGGDEADRPTPTGVATLRVTLRQAVYLTAAQNYAREVRLLPRPPGDRGRLGRAGVGEGGL
jgi:pilus assembly protein CpaB